MKKFFYLFLILFSFCLKLNFAQDSISETEVIDKKIQASKTIASSNPAEAKKELLELRNQSEKINYKDGAMKSSMGLLLLYYNDGDYRKTIEESRIVENYAKEQKHFEYISDVYRMRANTYLETGFIKECLAELGKALIYGDKIQSANIRPYKKALTYEAYAGVYSKEGDAEKEIYYRQKSIAETKKMPEQHPMVINAKYENLALQYGNIGLVYSNSGIKDSAIHYFEEALKIRENDQYGLQNINYKVFLLSDMAKFYDSNQEYHKAIFFAKKAKSFEKQAPMPYIRRDIYHSLFNSYVETDKRDSSKYYLKLYTSLNDSLIKSEKENIITPFNQIISDKETEYTSTIRNVLISSFALILFIVLFFWIYTRIRNKKFNDLIKKIKTEKIINNAQEAESIAESYEVKLGITDETIKILLQKLIKFEKSDKYLQREISRPWLAIHLTTNIKYLSEIIKIRSNKTFTDYIHGLRIDYITKKLVEDPIYREYKIEYLANECGYGSRQVFISAFKKETGFTPSYFIEKLKKDEAEKRIEK